MVPRRLLSQFAMVLVLCAFHASARVCENVHVRNSIVQLEKVLRGCTIVAGNLQIVLLEYEPISEHHKVTFPELTEVTGYVLLYRVLWLTSLGRLFPNLTVIRGRTLFFNYALIIHNLPELQEIGLPNLRTIGDGSVRIENCPHLCFVDTINWTKITAPSHSLQYFDANQGDCPACPMKCNGTCWNRNNCQVTETETCHPECIGCRGPGSDECSACKSYSDNYRCVAECPKEKFQHPDLHMCVTESECSSILKGTWWIFEGQCINKCPRGYDQVSREQGWCSYFGYYSRKDCSGGRIYGHNSANDFRDCTHIGGNLEISVNSWDVANELEDILGKVQEISGYLKVTHSGAVNSLGFLKKLRVIWGKSLYVNKYALVVLNNNNLYKLWDWGNFSLNIEKGTVLIHNNPHLCINEIRALTNITQTSYTEYEVSQHSNGDRTNCNFIELEVAVTDTTSSSVTIAWQRFLDLGADQVVAYTLYYTKDNFKRVSMYDGKNECFDDTWTSVFVSHTFYTIPNLQPHTQYAFYVQVKSRNLFAGQTAIQHFRTLPGEPAVMSDIYVDSLSSDSIRVTWKPPENPAGVLTHYEVAVSLQKDDTDFIMQQNFCFNPNNKFLEEHLDEQTPLEQWTDSFCCTKQDWDHWKGRFRRSLRSDSYSEKPARIIVNASHTNLTIKPLRHFSTYILYMRACNDVPSCSSAIMAFQRTQPKVDADDIPPGLSIDIIDKSSAYIKWLEPIEPNSLIVAYKVIYRRNDHHQPPTVLECLTRQDYIKNGYGHKIDNLQPGNYSLYIKAVSLAGSGRQSEAVTFEIIKSESVLLVCSIVVTVILVLVSLGLIYHYWDKRSRWTLFTNSESLEFLCDQYEIKREDLDPPEIRQGAYGIICNGFIKSQNRPCTVKVGPHAASKYKQEFLQEASTMKLPGLSYHVVSLLGIVANGQPPLVVMELMAWGDLKSFLRETKGCGSVTHAEMYKMAAEIADGMMYLASKELVHRDLATRNCLVSAGHTVKVVIFGINKDLYETDYYKDENKGLVPVRWMAPESLADGMFTSDSNVWSYGVVLWEIVTFAARPYQDLSDNEVIRHVLGQQTLERPTDCPDLLHQIMTDCWKWRSRNRSTFCSVLKRLKPHVRRNFKLISFYYSKEASEFKRMSKNREEKPQGIAVPINKGQAVKWSTLDEEIHLLPSEEAFLGCDLNLPSTSSAHM